MSSSPNDLIKEVKEFQKHLNEAAENTQDVKDGKCTPEDEKQEPAFRLYNSIAESTVKILQNEVVQRGLMEIGQICGEKVMRALVQIMTISMTYSAHEAIVLYDEMLKQELIKQFDNLGTSVNSAGAVLQAHEAIIKVMQSKIQSLENKDIVKGGGG